MVLKKLRIQPYDSHVTNCYIVLDEESKETMVIDPGGNVEEIINVINVLKGKLKYIYLTHCHVDHIAGVQELKRRMGGIVIVHVNDADGLKNKNINMSVEIFENGVELEADSRVHDEDLLHLGNLQFKVIHTPRSYSRRFKFIL